MAYLKLLEYKLIKYQSHKVFYFTEVFYINNMFYSDETFSYRRFSFSPI